MSKIKKGDLVQVITGGRASRGGDRGKTGRVLEVDANRDRVIVEGINFVTKHTRVGQTNRGTRTGGIETQEAPIHVSNVALIDPESKKPTRVRREVTTNDKNGVASVTKIRVASKSGKEIKSND